MTPDEARQARKLASRRARARKTGKLPPIPQCQCCSRRAYRPQPVETCVDGIARVLCRRCWRTHTEAGRAYSAQLMRDMRARRQGSKT